MTKLSGDSGDQLKGAQGTSADVERAWTRQRVWSLTANRLKAGIDRARSTALVLGLVGAALAVAAAQVPDETDAAARALAVVAGVLAGLGPLFQRRAGAGRIRDWTRARSASEALKAEVYRHLAGEPGKPIAGGIGSLAHRTEVIETNMADLLRHTLAVVPDGRPVPAVHDIESYIDLRVRHQADSYYRPKAALYQKRGSTLRSTGEVLGAVAVVFGAAGAAGAVPGLTAWVPVLTTASASLTAHIAASRYDYHVVEFLRTTQRLEHLRREWDDGVFTPQQFLDACEEAISIENQAWMTRWTDVL